MTSKKVQNFCYADLLLLKHNKVVTVNLMLKFYFSTIIIDLSVCLGLMVQKPEKVNPGWPTGGVNHAKAP
jgi:hypothetical protein